MAKERTLKTVYDALVVTIFKDVDEEGMFTISTCDHPNWDKLMHIAMMEFARKQNYLVIPHYHIQSNLKHGVTDWIITKK